MNNNSEHFNKLFWFCCACVAIGLAFLITLCFVPIPKGSERFADNCQGFFQGSIVTAAMAFLLGGNLPLARKAEATPGTTTASITADITTEAKPTDETLAK